MTARGRHHDAAHLETGRLRRSGVATDVLPLVDGAATAAGDGAARRPCRETGVAAVQRAAKLAAESRRDERVDERIHARVGVREHVRANAAVVEPVRVSPRRPEEVGPQPDDVRRQPADGEDDDDDDDESGDPLLGHDRLPLRRAAVPGRLRRPELNDRQRAERSDRRHWYDVVDDEQNEKAGRTIPPERRPVVGADRERRDAGQLVLADRVDGDPRRGEHQRRRPHADDDGERGRRLSQVLGPQRVPDGEESIQRHGD